ncbi:RNA polymerase sigma-70 factor, ECF subfamily [Anaeromicropila populeti]|uniref:RNA polymerase sigma-70 factor, ECF subfamily n=1 Tax=Anaeromicropila populeti TaxID=37658 RepID=A0A1I6IDI0_9FIRM|nr:RNA polymerase sigma-70 factor, ECF subfamily [Anaeromicropila populeti]
MQKDNIDKLYQQHSQMIYRFHYFRTGNRELAEELTQETFYQAFLSYDNFRGECKASTWLYQIAKNVWRQYQRKKRECYPIEKLLEQIPQEKSFDPLNAYLAKEEKNTFCNALKQLTKEMQEVVILRVVDELKFSEIGEIMNKSETWSRTNYFRAKKKLQEYIDNMESGD